MQKVKSGTDISFSFNVTVTDKTTVDDIIKEASNVIKTRFADIEVEPEESEDERMFNRVIESLVCFRGKVMAEGDEALAKLVDKEIQWMLKCKESLHISESCKENPDSFTDEDERIREKLYNTVMGTPNDSTWFDGTSKEAMLAWLEKQKEQKPSTIEKLRAISTPADENWLEIEKKWEKEDEQKSVEIHNPTDEEAESWENELTEFKRFATKQAKENQLHISYTRDIMWENFCSELLSFVNSRKPAEWSEKHIADIFEKVGLAKIVREQGNDALTNAVQSAMIELSKVRNTEWSEEDENVYESIQTILLAEARFVESVWVDSIKARIKSVCWDEKDEKMLQGIIERGQAQIQWCDTGLRPEQVTWLKSLRSRPSSSDNWKPSKDEERLINTSISFLKDFADKGYENAVECIDWLKSKLNGDSGK